MRIRFRSEFSQFIKFLENAEDIANHFRYREVAQKFLNLVYARIYKKHSTPYSYMTPVGNTGRRQRLRKRSGKLLNTIKNSRYMRQLKSDLIEVGFELPSNDPRVVINTTANSDSNPRSDRIIKADGAAMTIPLREALHSNGTKKKRSMRNWGSSIKTTTVEKALQFGVNKEPFSLNGEKLHPKSRIVCIRKGGTWVPLYLLVRKVKVPRRMDISEDFDYVWDTQIDNLVVKEFDRILNAATNSR